MRRTGHGSAEAGRIKLEDGIHAHEHVRLELEKFATETGKPKVRPFMLVVAQDTDHARSLREIIQSDTFFGGYYKDRVIQVDSTSKSKEESDEITERLLKLETEGNTEIVIHVNMLKEGWDVTNLFTIVPLRASATDILTEQTLGRGLRLPYGERTKVEAIDRLTVIAHDRFAEVIAKAKEPGSVVATIKTVTIGEGGDIPATGSTLVKAPSKIEAVLTGESGGLGERPQEPFVFKTQEERTVAKVTLGVIQSMEREFKSLDDLHKPEVQAKIAERVKEIAKPIQGVLEGVAGPGQNVEAVVATVAQTVTAGTIAIPQIVVLPDSNVTYSFKDFDLNGLDTIGVRPMSDEITLQELRTERRSFIRRTMAGAVRQERLEDYLVSALFAFDEIDTMPTPTSSTNSPARWWIGCASTCRARRPSRMRSSSTAPNSPNSSLAR
jgi:type III restriction enzyme